MVEIIKLCFISLFILHITCLSNDNNANTTHLKSNYTSLFLTSKIPTLDDSSFDRAIRRGIKNPFLLLFTIKKCGSCNHIIELFENITDILSNTQPKIKTAKIDCFTSTWTTMRFTIDHIPKILYVENGTVRYLDKNITYENILDFIDNIDSIEPYPFPQPLGYLGVGKKLFDSIDDSIKKYMNRKGYYWHTAFTAILTALFIIVFAVIEWKFVNCCCKSNKKNQKKKCSHNHSHTTVQ